MAINFYYRNFQLFENTEKKVILYEMSIDFKKWDRGVDEKLKFMNLVDTEGVVLKSIAGVVLYTKNFRSLAEECKTEGTDYVRVVTKNNAFFLGKKSYFIGSSLQGKGFEDIKKIAQDILICESSIDCKKWISCIYKKEVATSYGDTRDLMPNIFDILQEIVEDKKKEEKEEPISKPTHKKKIAVEYDFGEKILSYPSILNRLK